MKRDLKENKKESKKETKKQTKKETKKRRYDIVNLTDQQSLNEIFKKREGWKSQYEKNRDQYEWNGH